MITEHDIIQNVGIGALALHKFSHNYYVSTQNSQAPSLALVMPVLPILFNKYSLDAIYRRDYEGGFYNALTNNRDIPAGLQERMEEMADHTFRSLNVAYATGILTYDKERNEIFPVEKKVKSDQYNSDIKMILKGADRLGYWFASMSFEQICILLKIKF